MNCLKRMSTFILRPTELRSLREIIFLFWKLMKHVHAKSALNVKSVSLILFMFLMMSSHYTFIIRVKWIQKMIQNEVIWTRSKTQTLVFVLRQINTVVTSCKNVIVDGVVSVVSLYCTRILKELKIFRLPKILDIVYQNS